VQSAPTCAVYIGGIERGERNVSLVNIGLLADALEVDLATLMAATDRERRPSWGGRCTWRRRWCRREPRLSRLSTRR
jgi:hypothetical protein